MLSDTPNNHDHTAKQYSVDFHTCTHTSVALGKGSVEESASLCVVSEAVVGVSRGVNWDRVVLTEIGGAGWVT